MYSPDPYESIAYFKSLEEAREKYSKGIIQNLIRREVSLRVQN